MSQDVRIRQIVRYTDYKQFRSTVKLIFEGQDVTNLSLIHISRNAPAAKPLPKQ